MKLNSVQLKFHNQICDQVFGQVSKQSLFGNVLIKLRSPVFENSYYDELIDLSILDYLKNNA